MNQKLFILLVIFLTNVKKFQGYQYGPSTDRAILYAQQYSSYVECQNNATRIRAELKSGKPVENVPPHEISDEVVTYYLFTRKNPKTAQILRSTDSCKKLRNSFLNFNRETVFYAHGYGETIQDGVSNFTTYLLPKKDVNVIIVNWDRYAKYLLDYTRNITVPRFGKILGRFVNKLIAAGADRKKITLIGFSAGGEAVGLAGKTINPKIARISAYDPEGSCFNFLPDDQRISKNDADYVLIVHCSVGIRALPPRITGTSTFYMNGAIVQPNCQGQPTVQKVGDCSHFQCENYLFESLKGNGSLVGTKCGSYSDYLLNRCDCWDRVLLTYDVPTSTKGFYYVDTTSNKPCY